MNDKINFNRVVIWGHPINTHNHSYIQYGWFKAFKYLGYDTYWYDDNGYPSDIDYTNTLFISEGSADKNIPINDSSIYCIYNTINPKKYINANARLIDLRPNVSHINDDIYIFNLDEKSVDNISDIVFYEKNSTDRDLNPRLRHHTLLNYEAIYLAWASDLLPDEINIDDINIPANKPHESYFIGNIHDGNIKEMKKYMNSCSKKGIKFVHINSDNPTSFETFKNKIQHSYVTVDIRGSGNSEMLKINNNGTNHKDIGFISCRIFKNISYGKLGITNCPRAKKLFGDNIIVEENEDNMVETYLKYNNYEYIKKQMIWVRDNHTYINRISDLLKVINQQV